MPTRTSTAPACAVAPRRVLTDVVALVRFALQQDEDAGPVPRDGRSALQGMAGTSGTGRQRFTDEQRWWLDAIKDTIAESFAAEHVELRPLAYVQHGGAGRAYQVFGEQLEPLLDEMNRELVA